MTNLNYQVFKLIIKCRNGYSINKACFYRAGALYICYSKVQTFLYLLLMTYSTRADSVLDTTEIENLH